MHVDWLAGSRWLPMIILPIVLSISFMLIANIDSPRVGLIHVRPLNLESLAQWLPKFHDTMLEEDIRHFAFNGEQANSPFET